MQTATFTKRTWIQAPAHELFHWHTRPGAFERLAPPWERVEVVRRTGGVEPGGRVEILVPVGPLRRLWVAEHTEVVPGRKFCDVQRSGPFASWVHSHEIEPGEGGSWLLDRIGYALPLGALGSLLGGHFVQRKLERTFDYRHHVTANDVLAHLRRGGGSPMKIVITGSTGLVGSELVPFLTAGGHQVVRFLRAPAARPGGPQVTDAFWDPGAGRMDRTALEGADAVIHLAGENIAGGRWNDQRKARIRDSRVAGTRLLSETLAGLGKPPGTLVCASAIGYYGSRGNEVLSESSPAGTGFLAEVCREWEAALEPAEKKGIRVVKLRIGVVLSPRGGALAKMLLPFKLGGGGVLGPGTQYISWIALDDLIGIIHHALVTGSLSGPVNAVSPQPVTNRELTRALGKVLSRPTIVPLPAFAARLLFGEMAEETVLGSTRVSADRVVGSGYKFQFPELEQALRHLLGK